MTMQPDARTIAPRLPASVEATPRQAIESAGLPGLFPAGTRVYIPDIGTDTATMVDAARRIGALGYVAVPHFAARRLTSRAALRDRVKALAEEAGVGDVLVIGGDLDRPAGDFASSMDAIETGLFDAHGIKEIAIAGHPEGCSSFPDAVALEALRLKAAFGARTDARLRIVTQFGFDAGRIVGWAQALHGHGIDLPVHVGVAGPARITTLVKYAAMCGVGNSLSMFRKRAGALTTLMTRFSPETVVEPVERHVAATPGSPIRQIHAFPFGGIGQTARWLRARGSWPAETAAMEAAAAG